MADSKQQPGAIVRWKSRRGNSVRGVVETTTERGAWCVLLNLDGTVRPVRAFRLWGSVEVEQSPAAGTAPSAQPATEANATA